MGKETTITLLHSAGLQRGDFVETSGFVNGQNNGVFIVRRVNSLRYLVEPAGRWDYVMHYVKKFRNEVQWKFWGVVNDLEDVWKRLRQK